MTDQNQVSASQDNKKRLLVMNVIGRIESQRLNNGFYYTRLITPAEDQYSMPSQFEVRSKQPLGAIGEVFKGVLKVSGFVRDRQYTDKNTGELKTIADRTVTLDLVI